MYAASSNFLAEISRSHRIATLCEIYVNGALQTTLIITDGNVNVQDTEVRRTATLTALDPLGTLTPATANDLLAPAGNEFKLYRGVVYAATGLTELIPLGMFRINDVKIYDSGDGFKIDLEGKDRATKVQLAKFTQEYSIAAGTNYSTAIQTLLSNRVPSLTFNFATTALTTPLLVFKTGDDPWAAARKMAASIGYDLFFDVNGVCTLIPVPTLSSSSPAVASYVEGAASTLLYINRRLTSEGVFSHVVVSGENNSVSAPVKAEAVDNNPLSPTYYLGKFGDVVDTTLLGSQFITTTGQAQTAANARLAKVIGFPDLVQIQALVNPAHEVGDIVQITRAKTKVNNKYLLDKITIPLTQDRAMALSCRQGVLAA